MGSRAHATSVIQGVTTKSQCALGIEVVALLHFLSIANLELKIKSFDLTHSENNQDRIMHSRPRLAPLLDNVYETSNVTTIERIHERSDVLPTIYRRALDWKRLPCCLPRD